MPEHYITLVLFVIAYALFALLPNRRSVVAVTVALLLVLFRIVSPSEALHGINWNVMGIFVGTLFAADMFIESRFPAWFAEVLVNRARSTAWAMLFICAMTGVISAFVENVATVLIVAPVALALARKLKMNPTSLLIAIAISSNLQGAATLIGDPPSMLLGGYAKMTFIDFFVYQGKPSIFFAVELGAIISFFVLFWVFRAHREKTTLPMEEQVKSWVPTVLLVVLIGTLALSSLFDPEFVWLSGTLCMVFGVVMILHGTRFDRGHIIASMGRLDWDTTFFLMAIFVIVESLTSTGWIERASALMATGVGGNVLMGYILLVTLAVAVSAFVDNVPFLAACLPIAQSMAGAMGIEPPLFLFGLLIGASLGGNITPIGAAANIVACGLLRQEGHPVTFRQFAAISVPFTIAAVVPAAVLVWFVWGP